MDQGNLSLWYNHWSIKAVACHSINYIHLNDVSLKIQDIWRNRAWCWCDAVSNIPQWLKLEVENLFLNDDIHDVVAWGHESNGIYTTSFTYRWLARARSSVVFNKGRGSWVWPLQIPENIKHFLGLLIITTFQLISFELIVILLLILFVSGVAVVKNPFFTFFVTIPRLSMYGTSFNWMCMAILLKMASRFGLRSMRPTSVVLFLLQQRGGLGRLATRRSFVRHASIPDHVLHSRILLLHSTIQRVFSHSTSSRPARLVR